jgi:peptide deformylase
MEIINQWEQSIVQKGNPVLIQKSRPVPIADIATENVQKLINDMHRILATQDDGVALAAPQIGADLCIFVVSKKIFKKIHPLEHLVYINPIITKKSQKKSKLEEGCLSVRGWYGQTHRHQRTTVQAYDENGKLFTRDASGLLSQIFQHETDHLQGILFDSHAQDLCEIDMNDLV